MAKHRKSAGEALAVDRISELPDSLCHQILRRLPATDARITCLLSRRWRLIWYSCPFYSFDEHIFRSSIFNHMGFPKFVNDTLQLHERYSKDSKIQFLRLSLLHRHTYDRHAFDYSLELARKMHVKELHLDGVRSFLRHFLTDFVLISQSITVLKLRNCRTKSSYPISMPALRTLDLEGVIMSGADDALGKFLSGCPSIENLGLCEVRPCSSLNIVSHKLKSLLVKSGFLKSRIEAPNLEFFSFTSLEPQKPLEIASSTRLKCLYLCSTDCVSDEVLEDLILQNPHLEKVELRDCFGLYRASIRSRRLRHLILHNCNNITELNIDVPQLQILRLTSSFKLLELSINAPHLHRFIYGGNLMNLSELNSSQLFEIEINLCCSNPCGPSSDPLEGEINLCCSDFDGLWYIKLKQLLEKFALCRVLKLKFLEDKQLVVPAEMRERFSIRGVENLNVSIGRRPTMNYSELLDGLRWLFPRLRRLEIEIGNPLEVHYKYCQTAGDIGKETIWKYMGFF